MTAPIEQRMRITALSREYHGGDSPIGPSLVTEAHREAVSETEAVGVDRVQSADGTVTWAAYVQRSGARKRVLVRCKTRVEARVVADRERSCIVAAIRKAQRSDARG